MRRSGIAFIKCWKMSRLRCVVCCPLVAGPPKAKIFRQPAHRYRGVPAAFTPKRVKLAGFGALAGELTGSVWAAWHYGLEVMADTHQLLGDRHVALHREDLAT